MIEREHGQALAAGEQRVIGNLHLGFGSEAPGAAFVELDFRAQWADILAGDSCSQHATGKRSLVLAVSRAGVVMVPTVSSGVPVQLYEIQVPARPMTCQEPFSLDK